MSVELECESCGHQHRMGDRTFDPNAKRTTCPECGAHPFVVDRGDLTWHPSKDE